DEAHERSLNIDFLFGILKRILPKRPDLQLIITSATINYERFQTHFEGAPVVHVSGRTFPVEMRYRPLTEQPEELQEGPRIAQAIRAGLAEFVAHERQVGKSPGDVLVFLPGEREIREVSQALRHGASQGLDVLPLYARLGQREQQRIFHPEGRGLRRVILATNVAETSLTVPGIRYVIDAGFARVSRYSARSRLQRLPIEPISQASANQRAGRCGRVEPGICLRLYAESDFQSRPVYTDPEIQRTNLASVVLQCLDLRLGDPLTFPFIDPPEPSLVRDGFNQLKELGFVSAAGALTASGRRAARLPLDPSIVRVLMTAETRQVFASVSVVCAALSVQDPWERDAQWPESRDPSSQFITIVNVWRALELNRSQLSASAYRKWVTQLGIRWNRFREWREVHRQIRLAMPQAQLDSLDMIDRRGFHVALLSGLYPLIGRRDQFDYQGVRQRRFVIPKGAVDGRPDWVMAAEQVETHRVVARLIAQIDPRWVIEAVPQLLKLSHSEPRWSKKQGRAVCSRTTRLFGLVLRERETVGLLSVDPREARDLFIREGIAHGQLLTKRPFLKHNLDLFETARVFEAKARRGDIVIDPEALVPWFESQIPREITDLRGLEAWLKKEERRHPEVLKLSLSQCLQSPEQVPDPEQFPEQVAVGHLTLPAEYTFNPGHVDDGVAVKVPLAALHQVDQRSLEWTVPGLMHDRAEALLRTLPKRIRRQLVPIPEFIGRVLPSIDPAKETLIEGLSRVIRHKTGVVLTHEDWAPEQIDLRLQLRIEVVDASGRVVDSDRELTALQARHPVNTVTSHASMRPKQRLIDWPSHDFEREEDGEQGGLRLKQYRRLQVEGNDVFEAVFLGPAEADRAHAEAVAALILQRLSQQVRWIETKVPDCMQALIGLGLTQQDAPRFHRAVVTRLVPGALAEVLTQAQFRAALDQVASQFVDEAEKVSRSLVEASARQRRLSSRLAAKSPVTWLPAIRDIQHQLACFGVDWLERTPPSQLLHLDRYLAAIEVRLEKLGGRLALDAQWQREVSLLWESLCQLWPNCPTQWAQVEPTLVQLRWQIEEFRVLCFAQALKTAEKVSFKRLSQQLQDYRRV
ncbi:MAG: ATP-dependent RNA helicase HrpA, partial [Gammaproteobacteria bacterium]|nr:ATP-dependent RNA helicase HrpA [Gammaproteobacteria bacterium]